MLPRERIPSSATMGEGKSPPSTATRSKFRVLTLRQLKDGKFFFHNGSFTSVKDVVQYFNKGVPQDAGAAAAGTLTPRFTNPRGIGSAAGLGLDDAQVQDLTDFLENGLYDPALVHFDPDSTTKTLEPNERGRSSFSSFLILVWFASAAT